MTKEIMEKIERVMDKLRGRTVEIRQLGCIRRFDQFEEFTYYICGENNELELVMGDETNYHESEPIEVDIPCINQVDCIECLDDARMILHLGQLDLLLATV
jgi:hypothetical protein